MTNNLLLGSGDWHWEGWVTLDANSTNQPDILAVVPPLPEEVRRRGWHSILASHVIEHVSLPDAKILLRQCYECLLPGGHLILEQPNIDYCMKIALGLLDPPEGGDRVQFGLQGIYGAQNGNHWDGHKWGYTPSSLTALLMQAGFRIDDIQCQPGKYHVPIRDFTLIAEKRAIE